MTITPQNIYEFVADIRKSKREAGLNPNCTIRVGITVWESFVSYANLMDFNVPRNIKEFTFMGTNIKKDLRIKTYKI